MSGMLASRESGLLDPDRVAGSGVRRTEREALAFRNARYSSEDFDRLSAWP